MNKLYKSQKALHEKQFDNDGFEWISYEDDENSVISYIRKGIDSHVVVICNMTPVVRENYRLGMPSGLEYKLLFNSDHSKYGGSSASVKESFVPESKNWNSRDNSAVLNLPPLGVLVYGVI